MALYKEIINLQKKKLNKVSKEKGVYERPEKNYRKQESKLDY
jgi:hypothetical protein